VADSANDVEALRLSATGASASSIKSSMRIDRFTSLFEWQMHAPTGAGSEYLRFNYIDVGSAAISILNLTRAGNVGIGTPTPSTKMQVRGAAGVGGFFDASGIAGSEIEILPAGGCVRTFMHTGATIWNSAGSAAAQAAQSIAVPGSGSTDLVMSGALTLRVYSTGRVTILRTSGTNTYTVAFAYVAI
jgi:hypothetical protein